MQIESCQGIKKSFVKQSVMWEVAGDERRKNESIKQEIPILAVDSESVRSRYKRLTGVPSSHDCRMSKIGCTHNNLSTMAVRNCAYDR